MSSSTYLDINVSTGEIVRRTGIASSTGSGDANKIIMTGADGKLDASLLPSITESAETIVASEALAAGDFVNIHEVSGNRRVRKAIATDNTKPAHGFVTSAVTAGADATVYLRGINTAVPTTGFVASDLGRPVFLSASTAGGVTKTAPSSAGNIVQRLGFVVEVGTSAVRVLLDMSYIVRL